MGLVMVKNRSKSNTRFYIIIGVLILFVIAFAYLYVEVYPTLVSAQNRYISLNNSYYLLKNNYILLNHTYQAAMPKIDNYTNLLSRYKILNSSYLQLKSNLSSPYIKSLYNGSFAVPGYSTNFVFYNSTYGLYNNYTLAGTYNLTFNLPYFGYLIIDLNNFSAHSEYEGFCVYSNSTAKYLSPLHLTIIPFGSGPTRAVTSDCYAPDLNYSESFIVPVPYGNTTLSFEDLSKFPATYNVSITYVGIRYSNMTDINFNYSR
jgi:hypothetical protein